MKSDKEKSLDAALRQLDKLGISVPRLGDTEIKPLDTVPSGSLSLDLALGVGGYPRGRIIEIYGHEMSGKSTLASICMGNAQKMGGTVVLVDAEHAFDPAWATKLGVDVAAIRVCQPDSGEDALEVVRTLAQTGSIDVIVVDSTASLVPKAELEGAMDQMTIGLQARMMSKALRMLTGVISKSNTAVIFINQIRSNVMVSYGNPDTTPGGKALRFYSSVRLEVVKLTGKDNVYKEGDVQVGHRVRVKVTKNKCAPPFRVCEFDLYYDRGIDTTSEIPKLAIDFGIVKLDGKTYSFGDDKAVGYDNFIDMVKGNPKLQETLKGLVVNAYKENRTPQIPVPSADAS